MNYMDIHARELVKFSLIFPFFMMSGESRSRARETLKLSDKKLDEVVQYSFDEGYIELFYNKYPYLLSPTKKGKKTLGIKGGHHEF